MAAGLISIEKHLKGEENKTHLLKIKILTTPYDYI